MTITAEKYLKDKGLYFASLGRSRVDNISVTDLMEEYHQQAMKEEKGKNKENIKKILQSIRSAASILPGLSICEFIDVILKDDI